MKKIMFCIALLSGLSLSAACSGDNLSGGDPVNPPAPNPNPTPDPQPDGGRYLVAYFSRSGNTEAVAREIVRQTGASLVEIVPTVAYPSDYDATLARSREEIAAIDANGEYPAIETSVDDFGDYDAVFICTPLWYARMATPVQSFLNAHAQKLAGRPIALAVTSSSTGISQVVDDAHRLLPDAEFAGEPLWVRSSQISGVEAAVSEWLPTLGLSSGRGNVGEFDLSAGVNGNAPTVRLNSGYDMPVLGLGTYSLLGDVCVNSVLSALRSGFRKFDTAYMYNNEESVGEAIRRSGVPREEIFVCTKLYPNQFADADNAIDMALRKLGLDYIDLMLLHHPGAGDVAAYKAMERAVAAGKIRSIGLSNYYIDEMSAFLPQVTTRPALVQNEIHPYYQDTDVIEFMHREGIVVEGWYPFGGRGHTAELFNDPVIAEIARAHGRSSAQVVLRWHLQRGVVVIPGSSNPDHIEENISVFDFALTDDEMRSIGSLNRDEKHDWY